MADKAAALDRYGAALTPIVRELKALHPPPASRPVWSQQTATLVSVRAAAAALAEALRRNQGAAVPGLLHRLSEAAAGNQSPPHSAPRSPPSWPTTTA